MAPYRRRFLRAVGGFGSAALVGLAGCTGDGPGGPAPPTDATPNGTRPSGTGGPGVSIVSVEDDLDLDIEPAVEVVREAATPEHPPRLRTTLANTGGEPTRVGEGRAVHFEYVADESGSLLLLPGEGGRAYPAEPGCWRLTEGVATTEEYRTFEIGAGDSSSRPVDLYATPDGEGCLPVGEYRFETTVSVVSADAEPQSSDQWGFTVLLE